MNPYAAPQADSPYGGGAPVRGAPQPWDVGDSVRNGWELYKANWAPLTFGYLVVWLIGNIPSQVTPLLVQAGALEQNSAEYWAVHGPLSFLGFLIGTFFAAGFARATLRAARGGAATFGDFFGGGSQYLPFLGMTILQGIAVGLGFLCLIVPGIILSLGFMMAPYYVIDQRLGPIEALKASWAASEGQKGNLFVLGLAQAGILLLGLLACCFGFFVAMPVSMLASTLVYMKMSGTAGEPGGGYGAPGGYPAAGGGYPPPAGGYGGPPAPGGGGYGPPGGGGYGPPGGGYGPPGGGGPPGYGPGGGGPPGY